MRQRLAQALIYQERAARELDLLCAEIMAQRVPPEIPLREFNDLKVDAQELRDEIRKVYMRTEEAPAPRSSAQAGVILTELLWWLLAFAIVLGGLCCVAAVRP